MKKKIALLLAVIMIIGLFGCNTGEKEAAPAADSSTATSEPAQEVDTGEPVTIRFFHRWPMDPRNAYFNEVVSNFEAENPDIKVDMDYVINDAYKEKIRVLVSSNDVPDIFFSWSDSFAKTLVSSGKIKPIDDLLDADPEWKATFVQSQFDNFTVDEQIYGAPLTIDGKVFAYNKTVFDELGLSVPKNYSELTETLETLKDRYNGAPLIEGLADGWAISHYLGTIFQRVLDPAVIATDYETATGEFTDPGYLRSLEIFNELVAYMGPNASSLDHTEARMGFSAGEHAIIYIQLAELNYLNNDCDFEFDYFNFPAVEDGKGDPNQLTGAPEGIMLSNVATGKKAEAAEKFLKYILSQENTAKFVSECGAPVAIEGAANETTTFPAMIKSTEFIKGASGSWPWFDNAVNVIIAEAFMKGTQSVIAGTMTNEELMAKVQDEAAKLR